MFEADLCWHAQRLADFIETRQFEPVTQRTPYCHMGATITDSILQAGLNYRYIVYPRVCRLLAEFSDYKTTCDFIILMQTIPLSELIDWHNTKKLQLIQHMSWLFYDSNVETEAQLAVWLTESRNIQRLIEMKGVGPKTVDYLNLLSGNQTIAIDRHLFSFLRLSGIFTDSYEEASNIYRRAADLLSMSEYELDRKIWSYMSNQRSNKN